MNDGARRLAMGIGGPPPTDNDGGVYTTHAHRGTSAIYRDGDVVGTYWPRQGVIDGHRYGGTYNSDSGEAEIDGVSYRAHRSWVQGQSYVGSPWVTIHVEEQIPAGVAPS